MTREAETPGEMPDHQHQRPGHQEPGHDPGEEQRADRRLRGHAVDDHRQRRRDDGPDRRRGGGDRGRGLGVVALLLHRRDLDGAEPGGVGDGRPAHAGEDHRADDVGVAQPAAHPPDQRRGEVEDPVADAGRIHHIAHQDEERRREQRKRVGRHRDLLRHDDAGDAGQKQEGEAGETHRRVDRWPEEQRDEPRRQDGKHQGDHCADPAGCVNADTAVRASASASAPTASAATGTMAYTTPNVKNSVTVSTSALRDVISRP